mgnify:CR=1 FL=1
MQETQFLVSLLENGMTSKQTALQLLATEHLYVPTLLPKLRLHAKRLKTTEGLERCLQESESSFEEYCQKHPDAQDCREYDV